MGRSASACRTWRSAASAALIKVAATAPKLDRTRPAVRLMRSTNPANYRWPSHLASGKLAAASSSGPAKSAAT